VPFGRLSPGDQREVLTEAPIWAWRDHEGVTRAEQLLIIDNVLAGKPQEKWLEGVSNQTFTDCEIVAETDVAKANDVKISLRKLRNESREQEKRGDDRRSNLRDIER
jgi:hypothetical protein